MKPSIVSSVLVAIICLGTWSTRADERPNIIIILVDDMGFSDLGCYGSEIETPNIDKLAAGGLRFTQFYNSGRCCPTRASLMTGLHPHQVGIGHMTEPPGDPLGFEGPYQGHLNDDCVTIAQVLQSADYHTLMTGKWHLGYHSQDDWPLQRGFDKFFGGISGAFNYFKPAGDRGLTNGNEAAEPTPDFYATDTFTDVACQYIEEATRADDKPFFLYLAYNAPHWPLNAKVKEFEKYRGKYQAGWEALMQSRLQKQKQIGLFEDAIVPAPHVGPKWDSLSKKKRDDLDAIMAAYAGCIDSIDQNIGKLTKHLEQLGKLDNTVIFLLSDNGACQEGGVLGVGSEAMVRNPPAGTAGVRQGLAWANASNTPFRLYKHFVHEGGACTPMIAHWPRGISPSANGSFVRQHAYLPDFMATCVELAAAEYPDDKPTCEGESLVPLLSGSKDPIHTEPIYWEHEGNAALRWGQWKLVKEWKKPWELYNIAEDRAEMNDLATSNAAKRDELVSMWEEWAKKHSVAYPERFNMYEFLNDRKKREKDQANHQQKPLPLPNIIVMMADDMGMGDSSVYQDWTGNADTVQVKTPSMERLARMGIRFTDAHSPSSRCTATRQALLTGRYTWRTRLKYSVLWGPQGDPLIEPKRPTLASVLRDHGYRTGMTGKWHCGLTYRDSQGRPVSDYSQVDLTQGIADGPLNHGFDFFHGTSRSHPTSKAQGWLWGDTVPAALGGQAVDESQYVLEQTGPKNFEMGMQFLKQHLGGETERAQPFFLYYACHSNHTSHDPCAEIAGRKVRGASHPGGKRSDFIYENDVALGLLMDFLEGSDDPRRPGEKLIDNTLIVFTSDNGAESQKKTATGPIRSNKASIYEGGHRVPFIAAWKLGGIGDGNPTTPGQSSDFPICHVDLMATFRGIVGASEANSQDDSFDILQALQGAPPKSRTAIIHNDHKEGATKNANHPTAAWMAIRRDNPTVDGKTYDGQWKLFVDHGLLMGEPVQAKELYDLKSDLKERRNRIDDDQLQPLVNALVSELKEIHDRDVVPAQIVTK